MTSWNAVTPGRLGELRPSPAIVGMTILQEVCLTRTSPMVLISGAIDQFRGSGEKFSACSLLK